jgi:ADP-ribosylglycohydrolase
MIPSPIMLYAAAGALVVGAVAGYKVRDWQCDAAYAKALEKAGKQRAKADIILDKKAAEYEETRAAADVRSVERTNTIREIYHTVPAAAASCAPPDDAIRVLLEVIGNPDTETAAGQSGEPVFPLKQPAQALPRPSPAAVGKRPDRAKE